MKFATDPFWCWCILFPSVPGDSLWPFFEMVKWPFWKVKHKLWLFRRVIFLMQFGSEFANARVVWSWKGFEYEKDSPKGLIYRYSSQFPVLVPGTEAMKPSVCLVCTASDSLNWSGTMRRDRDTLFWSFGSFEGCSQLATGAEKFLRYQSLVLHVSSSVFVSHHLRLRFRNLISCYFTGLRTFSYQKL